MAVLSKSGPGRSGIQSHPLFRRIMFALRFLTQLREWYIVRELGALIGRMEARSMLDAGCGYGEYSYFTASRHPDMTVTSLEVDEKLAADFGAFIRRAGIRNVSVVQGDVLGLEDRGEYDLVICGSVLEHIEDDEKALAKLVAALRPGGLMLVYVPTAPRRVLPFYRRRERKADRRAGGSQYGHVRDYSRAEIEGKMSKAGLVLQKSVITYGFWGSLAFEILYLFLPHSSRFSRRHWFILPLYFILLHPFVLLLMCLDILWNNKRGNGLMAVALRPKAGPSAD